MEIIYLKQQPNPEDPKALTFISPAVAIRSKEGIRLIPHPYGSETTGFDTLEHAIEAVHRAGYGAEFDGVQYPLPARSSASIRPPALRPAASSPQLAQAERAIPHLHQLLGEGNNSVIASAAFALGELHDQTAIPALIKALGNEDLSVRKNVSEALAKIGKPAVNGLKGALKDKNWVVRLSSVSVLLELIHFNPTLLSDVMDDALLLLKDENWIVRSQSAMFYGEAAKWFRRQQEQQGDAR